MPNIDSSYTNLCIAKYNLILAHMSTCPQLHLSQIFFPALTLEVENRKGSATQKEDETFLSMDM